MIFMKLFEVLKIKKYLAISIISAAFMIFFYPFIQVRGIIGTIDIWFANISTLNLILFLIFVVLFGLNLSLFLYNRSRKICTNNTKKVLGGTSLGTVFSFIVGVCPACTGFAGLIGIPLSVSLVMVRYNTLLISITIGLLLLSIYFSEGFK